MRATKQFLLSIAITGFVTVSVAALSLQERHDHYIRPAADETQSAEVKDLIIRRGPGEIELTKGRLYLCVPLDGRVSAAVFRGKGEFRLSAPTATERHRLRRIYDDERATEKFESLVLVFADSTAEELRRSLSFTPHGILKSVNKDLKIHHRFLLESRADQLYYPILKSLLNGDTSDFFMAEFYKDERNPRVYMINPFDPEEISLRRRVIVDAEYGFETVTRFPAEGADDRRAPRRVERDDMLDLEQIKATCRIAGSMEADATVELIFSPQSQRERCVGFDLLYDLIVDSVYTPAGRALDFVDAKERWTFWVELDKPLDSGEVDTIIVDYHGPYVERSGSWITVHNNAAWLPETKGFNFSHYDITFETPENLMVYSVGRQVDSSVINGLRTTRWKTNRKFTGAQFGIGEFESMEQRFNPGPTTQVYRSVAGHKYSGTARMIERVADDMARSSAFFAAIFGTKAEDTLRVVESGNLFFPSQVPGLILLPYINFDTDAISGYDLIVRLSNSCAQWFGASVRTASYHDRWITVGLDRYLALWYIQSQQKNVEFFNETMRNWRDVIYDTEKKHVDDNDSRGTLWRGYSTESSIHTIKSAYVFHMIRSMLRDRDTQSDAQFIAFLRDLYARFAYKELSTADFRSVLEEHTGYSLEWFFDQWVYGTMLPVFTYSFDVAQNGDGRYVIDLQIEGDELPDSFRALMPTLVQFADDQFVELTVLLKGQSTHVQLPPLPLEPQRLVVNNGIGVLCSVRPAGR